VLAAPAVGADSGGCPSPAAYTGAGTVGDPLLISTPGNLQQLRNTSGDWTKYVRLTADINMAGASTCTWGSTIGTTATAFTGTIDGTGHVVRGLNIVTASPESYGGFIGYLGANGAVKDFGFTGNVTVDVTVSGTGSPSATTYAGGLVGYTDTPTTISRSWASGAVSSTATSTSSGLLGTPPIPIARARVGGIVGYNQATVTDVYFTGSLAGTAAAYMTGSGGNLSRVYGGGIAGELSGGSIANAYSTAVAPAFSAIAPLPNGSRAVYSGGLVGLKNTAVTNSYWNSDAWPGNGAGQFGPAGTGTTAAGLASFATFGQSGGNWSITNGLPASTTWGICPAANGGTPFLAAFASASTCIATPNTPATPTAVAGNGQATVTVAQGTGAGDPPVTYLVTSNPDARTCTVTGASGSCDVTGLTNGTNYTFTATATNLGGTSAASAASSSVTPTAPPLPAQPESSVLSATPVVDTPAPAPRRSLVIGGVDLARRGQVITTGRVPQGATAVVQVARPRASSLSRGFLSNARVTTKCPISGRGSARTFTCRIRLGSGRWLLTTQARNGATVIASAASRVVVKAPARTAVTG
jgi:hypothetical protein